MAIVKGYFRPEMMEAVRGSEEPDMLFKESGVCDVGLGRWSGSKLVIEEEETP